MIHTIHTMTIRQYGLFEKTGDRSYLKRYKFVPLFLFKKQIERFAVEFSGVFNSDYTDKLQKTKHKIISYNKILQLSNLYNGLYGVMVAKTNNNILIGKLETDNKNLKYYINEIKRLTGIEIKSALDLSKLTKEIQRRTDKYIEVFEGEKPEENKTSFMQLAMAIFSVMDMTFNENMLLSEFADLKDTATEKVKKIDNARNKRNSK